MMDRRQFVKLSAGAAAVGLLGLEHPSLVRLAAAAGGRSLDRIGVQLYTVRRLMEQDFEGTLGGRRRDRFPRGGVSRLLWSAAAAGSRPPRSARSRRPRLPLSVARSPRRSRERDRDCQDHRTPLRHPGVDATRGPVHHRSVQGPGGLLQHGGQGPAEAPDSSLRTTTMTGNFSPSGVRCLSICS